MIDVVLLTRDLGPVGKEVWSALAAQRGSALQIFRTWGRRLANERRIDAIVCARNRAKQLGGARYFFFLDDDVVLERDCLRTLLSALTADPHLAAAAADYSGELRRDPQSPHIGMGATLFRREALEKIQFRAVPGRCECLCCVDDLRALGWRVEYVPGALARHLGNGDRAVGHGEAFGPRPAVRECEWPEPPRLPGRTVPAPEATADIREARILAAFDRSHVSRFVGVFLKTLRRHGNSEVVHAVGYGLHPRERRLISRQTGVELTALPPSDVMPPVRRLRDFGSICERLPASNLVAYWDAGDVFFQDSLRGLWELVLATPDRLLGCAEPNWYPTNQAVVGWTRTIHDPASRRWVFHLLSTHPFLNSGFAAGTAGVLRTYFATADGYLHSSVLAGTRDWGDQTALNLYCHTHPERWRRIDAAWNYCTHDRPSGSVCVLPTGQVVSRQGHRIAVVHGNAKSMRKLAIVRAPAGQW
jgi:hypothetical protein